MQKLYAADLLSSIIEFGKETSMRRNIVQRDSVDEQGNRECGAQMNRKAKGRLAVHPLEYERPRSFLAACAMAGRIKEEKA